MPRRGSRMMVAPAVSATRTESSVLPLSTTMISSGVMVWLLMEARQSRSRSASLRQGTTTVSVRRGEGIVTRAFYTECLHMEVGAAGVPAWFILDSLTMSTPTASPTIVWFRDELRIRDNAALTWAAGRGPVIGLFIDEDQPRPLGGAARWWRERSLAMLVDALATHGVPLLRRSGDPVVVVAEVARETGADAVTWNRRYHGPLREVDAEIKTQLREQGLEVHSHAGFLLTEPWEVTSGAGTGYKVYTPFSKAAFPLAEESAARLGDPMPAHLSGPDTPVAESGWAPAPEPFWAAEMAPHCHPGEQ